MTSKNKEQTRKLAGAFARRGQIMKALYLYAQAEDIENEE